MFPAGVGHLSMSKFWSCQAVTGTAAAIALTVSVPTALASPKTPHHRAGVSRIIPVSVNRAATVPLPTPAPARPRARDAAATNSALPVEQKMAGLVSSLTSGSSIFMADVLVGEKLKTLVSNGVDRYTRLKRDRDGVEQFYRGNGYAPVWITNGTPNGRAMAVTAMMKSADADGLDPANYRIPDFGATNGDPVKLAEAELRFTDAVLTYARHAQAGRFGAQHITTELEVTQVLPDAAAVLQKVTKAANAAEALNSYNPPHAGYKALKAKLAELRANPVKTQLPVQVVVPAGPTLKAGMKDPRVPLLRKRLNVAGNKDNTAYDAAVIAAVRRFQQAAELRPDGVLGPRSLALLNAAPAPVDRTDAVVANMERWRWLPRDLGAAHVVVNIPSFTLSVVNRGNTVWTTRVVVGKAETPTPLISAEIATMQVNPTWHVPESIIYNEYLPALQRDPRILERMGLVLERNREGRVVVKQPPGEENALGQIKFNFPNRFQVYLHDTPTKYLFARSRRAYSHGCMRVENPAKFGEVLLSLANPRDGYTEARLQEGLGGPEKWIKLRRKIPVHLVYMSAYVDDQGSLVVREDIYGIDKKLTAILKGDDRRMANSYTVPAPKPTVIEEEKRRELERYVDGPRDLGAFLNRLFR